MPGPAGTGRQLDPATAISWGGWDRRCARTLAVAESGDVAAALVDTNGDGVEIVLDTYRREPEGEWRDVGGSADVGAAGSAAPGPVAASWGRGRPGSSVEAEHLGARRAAEVSAAGWWLVVNTSHVSVGVSGASSSSAAGADPRARSARSAGR